MGYFRPFRPPARRPGALPLNMNAALSLFLPCAAGVEELLAAEVHGLTGLAGDDLMSSRGGVFARGSWRDMLTLNLRSRLAQRVLIELAHAPYRGENDLYALAGTVAWEDWFTPAPDLQDRDHGAAQPAEEPQLRHAAHQGRDRRPLPGKRGGVRPSIETRWPDVRVFAHLTHDHCTLYIDTSGEPLFKRGWRADKGDAPLKETLAAAHARRQRLVEPGKRRSVGAAAVRPLLRQRHHRHRGGADRLRHRRRSAAPLRLRAAAAVPPARLGCYQEYSCSAANAGRALRPYLAPMFRTAWWISRSATPSVPASPHALQLRGGDALQRLPPAEAPGLIVLNPPYGERIEVGGVARSGAARRVPASPSGARRPPPTTAANSSPSSPPTGRSTTPAGTPGC